MTGRASGGKRYRFGSRLNIGPHADVAASVVRRDTGQVHARTEESKCPDMVKRRGHHSLSTSEETTARQVTLARGVIDTGCSRFLIGQATLEKWERMLARKWVLNTQRIQLAKAMTFRFGNDETLEARTLAFLPVGIAGVS